MCHSPAKILLACAVRRTLTAPCARSLQPLSSCRGGALARDILAARRLRRGAPRALITERPPGDAGITVTDILLSEPVTRRRHNALLVYLKRHGATSAADLVFLDKDPPPLPEVSDRRPIVT